MHILSNSEIQNEIDKFTSSNYHRNLLRKRFIEAETYDNLGIIRSPHIKDNDVEFISSFETHLASLLSSVCFL